MLYVINIIEKQNKFINSIINKQLNLYLKYIDTLIFNLFNKFNLQNKPPLSSSSKLKLIKEIETGGGWVNSICFLRDGRLVSSGERGIKIYHQYTPCIFIYEDNSAFSVCVLRNGNLLSAGDNGDIKIYEIGENEYKHIHTLRGHSDRVTKVIELEDGRLSSSSRDKTIIIWDNNYQIIETLKAHTHIIWSIIEMNDYILSYSDYYGDGMIIWNKHTYKSIKNIPNIYCYGNNSLSKLKENTVISGGVEKLYVIDVLSFQYKIFDDKRLGNIRSILVLKEDQILLGNNFGKIICYDLLSKQIICIQSPHRVYVYCIIKTEDNKILSSDSKGNINLYT